MMLSRKEVRAKQTQLLLDNGFLPVSVDYRLVPEMNVIKGPMTDVCSALEVRQKYTCSSIIPITNHLGSGQAMLESPVSKWTFNLRSSDLILGSEITV